jgi:hypothetical protein
VTLALAGPALVFIGPLLVWWLNVRRTAKAGEREREQKAYSDLLVASLGVSLRASTLLTVLKNRSGLQEGVMVTLRQRQQIDALQLHDWIGTDSDPLLDAWSRAWTYGSVDGVALANRLVDSCFEVTGLLDQLKANGLRDKGRQFLFGLDTDRLAPERTERIKVLAVARRDLADYMRAETGRAPADLFSSTTTAEPARSRRSWGRLRSRRTSETARPNPGTARPLTS